MTAKRFIAIDDGFDFMVRDTFTGDNLIDAEGVEDVLNDYEKENEHLKQQIADWETSFDLLKHKNEQLKQQEKRLYNYFRKCFNNVSEQGFRETWEVVKKYD